MKLSELPASFRNALNGLVQAVKKERNLKIHFMIMILVIIAGLLFHISVSEWLVCLLCFALVISSELFNTALEKLADRITRESDPDIRFSKDVSAGAVLFTAIMAALCGLVIFLPKLLALFR